MAARAGAAASLAAINEKARAAKAASTLAQSLHFAFGVDHFNGINYLMKLSERELLEERERLLAKAAAIDAALARKAAIAAFRESYALLQPRLADRAFLESCVHKPLLDALRGKRTSVLWGLLEEEAEGVYTFPCLTRECCDALLGETDAFCEAYDAAGLRATGDRPVALLDAMGLGGLADFLLHSVIAPLSALLFPAICDPAAGGGALDYRHPFIIGYTNRERILLQQQQQQQRGKGGGGSAAAPAATLADATTGATAAAAAAAVPALRGAASAAAAAAAPAAALASAGGSAGTGDAAAAETSDRSGRSSSDSAAAAAAAFSLPSSSSSSSLLVRDSLVYHTDDAEVTLNVSLGRGFTGGELVLRGLRNAAGDTKEAARITPQVGRGVLHLGTHFHEVLPVTAGERYALIMWARSSGYRATLCPCCLLARRTTDGCICGAAFN